MDSAVPEASPLARRTFAPIAGTYDRYARLLSFGQDARWRRFLVERVTAGPGDRVLDVACGTGAISLALARRHGCAVVGVDVSGEMLGEGRRRVAAAGLAGLVDLQEGRAEELAFPDASFDGVTFGYLLRYVEDPAATMRELVRVVRPGGTVGGLEFHVPPARLARAAWRLYVGRVLPALGGLVSPGWREVGHVLERTIEPFYREYPLDRQLADWRAAGLAEARARILSLGGGVAVWGTRGG